ncbi:3'-5' exonuclease [Halomonas sp. SL1]|uniref:3'-5' exonuclease n=1 Tax=Halomonas sp. SL1 TaxID=2137478 RepID=UPI000D165DA9|nr:3'-5' exonuclease [Halomonas sp. SL1]RAH37444.1 3'-5' exoribonuclease [Halomonas sp. SL1]
MTQPIDISIDLETLAKGPDAAILAIGIVDSYGVAFSCSPSVAEQVAEGRAVDDDTLHWWFQQSDEARGMLVAKPDSLKAVREHVRDYFQQARENYDAIRVWGNAPSFDCEILGHFLGGKPWRYYHERDVRTAREILDRRTQPRIAHSALGDAEAQLADVLRFRQAKGLCPAATQKGGKL